MSGDAIAYVAWVFVADGLIFTIGSLMWRGWGVVPMQPKVWVVGSFASLASYGAYAISIWAMTVAPIALAHWTRNVPTPPDAAWTRIVSLALSGQVSNSR